MKKRTCKFKVDGQSISYMGESPIPATDSKLYLEAEFVCDGVWKELNIMAVFSGNGNVYNAAVDESNKCLVPWELLVEPARQFEVGLVGFGSEGYRITTNQTAVRLRKSCFIEGETPEPPTPDIYETIASMANEAKNAAILAIQTAENAKQTADGVRTEVDSGELDGQDGQDGRDGITPSIGANGNWFIGEKDTGSPSRGATGDIGERGYSGLFPLVQVEYSAEYSDPASPLVISANRVTEIGVPTASLEIALGTEEDGFDNEWIFTVTQGAAVQNIVLPAVHWGLGIAPVFPADSVTQCRIYKMGGRLCGEWVAV